MKKHNSNKQITTKGDQKETFAFYIGIDLGDKMSDVCVLDPAGEVSDSATDERNRLSGIFHGHSAQSRSSGSRRAVAVGGRTGGTVRAPGVRVEHAQSAVYP